MADRIYGGEQIRRDPSLPDRFVTGALYARVPIFGEFLQAMRLPPSEMVTPQRHAPAWRRLLPATVKPAVPSRR